MGQISNDVRDIHLRTHPAEEEVLRPFLYNFDIEHARRINVGGAQVSAYLLSPDRAMRDGFSFSDEILLLVSGYSEIQARIFRMADSVYSQRPFKDRADPLTYFLVSRDKNVESWTSEYLVKHPQARSPIPIIWSDTNLYGKDAWFIRNKLSTQLYSRDLFDYKLPLDDDLLFFGRGSLISAILDSIRKGQNRGIFGLRKTGKTSVLFKLQRTMQLSGVAFCMYYDCKLPDVRTLRWGQLIDLLAKEIYKAAKRTGGNPKGASPTERMMFALRALSPNQRVCLIFDEIEFISPLAQSDRHWQQDFVSFWQTLWSIQSQYRQISFIIAGVNPYVCEIDTVDGIPNPMFGIVTPTFLKGLDEVEISQMLSAIGGKMGIVFRGASASYLFKRYGGHPLLTRMACSYTNRTFAIKKSIRPVTVDVATLSRDQRERENDLYFYCRYIVSELKQFYRDEYDMMEIFAAGNVVDFNELSQDPGLVNHLLAYGVIIRGQHGRHQFNIPVLQRFVAGEKARREGRGDLRDIIEQDQRSQWMERRKQGIIDDLRVLLSHAQRQGKWQLYGQPLIPESHLIASARAAENWAEFGSFITNLHKSLGESLIVIHGRDVLFSDVKTNYPYLFDALRRIRLYRNNADHLRLRKEVEKAFDNLISEDLFGRSISQTSEPWFLLQQICLDELFSAIQYEINELSDPVHENATNGQENGGSAGS